MRISDWSSDLCSSDLAAWGGVDETASSGLCFTSGTTGAPKGVTYTHRSSYLHTLRLLQADVMGLTAADAVLAGVPRFHANAWGLPGSEERRVWKECVGPCSSRWSRYA